MGKVFKVRIIADNEAFDGDSLEFEISRILREIADRLTGDAAQSLSGDRQNIRDVNGNSVGTYVLAVE